MDNSKSSIQKNLSVNNVSPQNIENNPPVSQTKVEKRVSKLSCPPQESQLKIKTWKDGGKFKNNSEDKSLIVDQYSGIRIMNPLVMPDEMKQRMQNRKMIKMTYIKNFIRGGDIEGDWVTVGVVVQKVPPKTSKNGKTFSIWKMTDLHDCDKIVSVFLFGATHTEHWKTSVGTVVGILNPSIMPSKENNEISLSVDNPKKFMIMGTSKDFGHCKAPRKDGSSCNVIVNIQQCEFCTYHVKNEYKKFSSKRSAVQSSYSGRGEPCLKNKILKGQNVFYGGQMYTPPPNIKKSSITTSKDKLTLSNLTLKRKAEAVETDERAKSIQKISEIYGPEVAKAASSNSEFINTQLSTPSVGSRNFLRYMVKDIEKKEQKVSVITPEELLKIHKKQFEDKASQPKQKTDQAILQDLMPKLGRGLNPGQKISLNGPSQKAFNALTPEHYAKLKAIKKIQQNGPLKKKDPNSVKTSPEGLKKVESVLNNSVHPELDAMDADEKILSQPSRLGINLDQERIKEIMNRKSSHSYEVETEEIEREEQYFNRLEKKEQMEDKMASTMEIVCDVVSCKQCKYTADHAVDRCKAENHPLKCHKAIKRFFRCKDCSRRTFCYTKLPTKPCRSCSSTNFERTGMHQPRSGPKLGSENLSICGNDMKYLNSLQSEKSFLHI
ncbi:protein MCM10 homolog [Uloborus diversus]|uniref:protein MCM10 homolog n=1 Tax=Uloborus diversus TaxID=327109 RepID=UPI00240A6428|nr:protein MCM10 homolog [Uloborus diversus]